MGGSKKSHGSIGMTALVVVGALLVLASVATYGLVKTGLNAVNHDVKQKNLFGAAPAPTFNGSNISGPLNMLIVGVDASGVRTDSIIIAHIPANHDAMYLVSIPRDTKVNVPSGGTNKINSTFNGGLENLANTIKLNYGITFNAGLIVNFDGFEDIVTKLGGINMYVDETTYSIHHGYVGTDTSDHVAPYAKIDPNSGVPICANGLPWSEHKPGCTKPGVTEVVYPKGNYHFDAYDALDFVRCRDGLVGTDYARQRHQQQFIRAVMQAVYSKGLSDPTKLLGLATSLGKAFTFDGRGTSLSDWIFSLKGISPASLVTIKTNDGMILDPPGPSDGHGSEQWLSSDTDQLLNDVRDDSGKSDLVATFLAAHPTWIVGGNAP
jgi:polyisoprenyl-teichoic acid--peptidoglycan teichoic acid transferase